MRVFIAIKLDNDIKSHLKDIADELSPYFSKARFTFAENYHLTIMFIGEVDRTAYEKVLTAVKRTASLIEKFNIHTSGPGSFKKKNKYIFFCSLNISNKLQSLYDVLSKELFIAGVGTNQDKFTPHITLAREVVLFDRYPEIKSSKKEIKVDSISLMESTRVNGKLTYIPRFTANLRG